MPNAKLGEQGVDGADLNSSASTPIANLGGADVVIAIRHDQRQRAESFDDVLVRARAGESLKELLQYEAGCHDGIRAAERLSKRHDLRRSRVGISTERERPHARVDEQCH